MGWAMSSLQHNLLISRACRVIIRDEKYSRPRTRALISWLHSEWAPTSDIARVAILRLGPRAFDDLLVSLRSSEVLPHPNCVCALALFPDQQAQVLRLLRDWIAR